MTDGLQRSRTLFTVLGLVSLSSCYAHHLRPLDDTDAGARTDAARDAGVDAGADDGGFDAGVDGCVGPDCDIVADFDGLRWELPCTSPAESGVCDTRRVANDSFVARGPAGARYAVTLRFRGVVETAEYSGGVADGFFYVGGSHYGGAWNLYALDVASPARSYFLNAGEEGLYHCFGIDYVQTVEIDVGATVSLRADSVEERQIANRDPMGAPIVVPDVDPSPEPYDGQFIQMDVVEVVRVR